MKILSLARNEHGQIIAEVLDCGKNKKLFASNINDLTTAIYKNTYFSSKDEIKLDIAQNYSDFV